MNTHDSERATRVADRHSFPGDLTRIRTLLQDAKSYLLRALESPLPDSQASIATFPVSNSPLPSLQHQTVKEDISALTTHAHTLEAQASLARTIVECLEAQSKRFSAKAEDLKVVIAPHKSLPDNLLSEIFLATVDHALCIPSQSWLSYGRVDPTTEAPWSLLQVCSRWRRIALEDVRLWNKLRLLYRLNIPGARQLTQRALFYSKGSQLYLCGTDEETHSLRLSDDLIRDVLIPHSTRIVHGNFHLSTSVQFSNSPPYFRSAGSIDLPNLPPSHAFLPSLKKLSLSIEHNPDYPIDDAELWKTVNFFLGSSRLESLKLTLNGRQISSESCFPLNLPLRWETLKCLRIEDTEIAPSTAYRLLTMTAANLTEVGLQVAPFVQPVQMLELPHLRLMYLVGHSARILDTLKADNLTEFYFRPPGSPQSFSIWQANLVLDEVRAQKESNTIQSFLMRSSAPLHHLHLVLPSFSLDLDPFLRLCPSLETVEALYNKLSISTIQYMTKARLWPKDMAVSMNYADLPFLEVSLSKQFANFRNGRKRKLAPFVGCPRSMKIIPFNDHSRPLSVREVRPQTAYNQMEARLMNVCPQKLYIQLMPYESLINRV